MKMKKTVVGLIGLSKKQKVTQKQNVKKHVILDNLSYGQMSYGKSVYGQTSNGKTRFMDRTSFWISRLMDKMFLWTAVFWTIRAVEQLVLGKNRPKSMKIMGWEKCARFADMNQVIGEARLQSIHSFLIH